VVARQTLRHGSDLSVQAVKARFGLADGTQVLVEPLVPLGAEFAARRHVGLERSRSALASSSCSTARSRSPDDGTFTTPSI
jgi:hypothetical protein